MELTEEEYYRRKAFVEGPLTATKASIIDAFVQAVSSDPPFIPEFLDDVCSSIIPRAVDALRNSTDLQLDEFPHICLCLIRDLALLQFQAVQRRFGMNVIRMSSSNSTLCSGF
jgi:hypothetical protein